MINYELYCPITDHRDHRQLTVAQIARELHLDTRTIARWVVAEKFQPRKAWPRSSRLDPCKKQIVRCLESYGSCQSVKAEKTAGSPLAATLVRRGTASY